MPTHRTHRRNAVRQLFLVGLVLVLTGGACVPSDPGLRHNWVGVRETQSGEVEILTCTRQPISEVQVAEVLNADSENRRERTVWRVELDPARPLEWVTLGEAPSGASETTPLPADAFANEDALFAVDVLSEDGEGRRGGFEPGELSSELVLLVTSLMTVEDAIGSENCDLD